MKRTLAIAAALAISSAAGSAFAQSGQGGYLGLNPGKNVGSSVAGPAPAKGSGQGGAIGLNPGKDVVASNLRRPPTKGSGQGGAIGRNPAAGTP